MGLPIATIGSTFAPTALSAGVAIPTFSTPTQAILDSTAYLSAHVSLDHLIAADMQKASLCQFSFAADRSSSASNTAITIKDTTPAVSVPSHMNVGWFILNPKDRARVEKIEAGNRAAVDLLILDMFLGERSACRAIKMVNISWLLTRPSDDADAAYVLGRLADIGHKGSKSAILGRSVRDLCLVAKFSACAAMHLMTDEDLRREMPDAGVLQKMVQWLDVSKFKEYAVCRNINMARNALRVLIEAARQGNVGAKLILISFINVGDDNRSGCCLIRRGVNVIPISDTIEELIRSVNGQSKFLNEVRAALYARLVPDTNEFAAFPKINRMMAISDKMQELYNSICVSQTPKAEAEELGMFAYSSKEPEVRELAFEALAFAVTYSLKELASNNDDGGLNVTRIVEVLKVIAGLAIKVNRARSYIDSFELNVLYGHSADLQVKIMEALKNIVVDNETELFLDE